MRDGGGERRKGGGGVENEALKVGNHKLVLIHVPTLCLVRKDRVDS